MWQALLAAVAGVALTPAQRVVLAATVWLAYAADRWIEGWHLHWRDIRTERHHFYQRHRWPVAVVWVVVFIADVVIAFTRLSERDLIAGAALIAPVLLYLLSHQLVHRHHPWRAPKELVVAALVTGGLCVFLTETVHTRALASSASLFALLCFANCALISAWEREVDLSHGQTSLAIDAHEHRWAFSQLPWLVVALAVVAAIEAPPASHAVAVCVGASGLLLVAVDRIEPRAGWQAARVLADVVLLTPLIPLLWHR